MKKNLLQILPAALMLACAALPAAAISIGGDDSQDAKLYAVGDYNTKGVYTFSLAENTTITKLNEGYTQYHFYNSGGAFVSKECAYGTGSQYGNYAGKITASSPNGTWQHEVWTYSGVPETSICSDMTFDPATGKIYGCFKAGAYSTVWNLATYNGDTFATEVIGPLDTKLVSIAAAENGSLYGLDRNGTVYAVDKSTAALTELGRTGKVADGNNFSAAVDFATGKLYFSAGGDSQKTLYAVNPADMSCEKVFDFPAGQSYNAFYIPAPDTKKVLQNLSDLRA